MATRNARQFHFEQFLAVIGKELDDFVLGDCDGLLASVDDLLSVYAVSLLDGNNILRKEIRANTVKGYIKDALEFAKDRGKRWKTAVDYKSDSKLARLIRSQISFETKPERRLNFTNAMVFAICVTAIEGTDFLGLEQAIADWVIVGRQLGQRCQEFAQDKDDEVQIYVLPDGREVVRAFTRQNITFCDDNQAAIAKEEASNAAVTFDIQKNRENNQTMRFERKPEERKRWCVVGALERIVDRATQLNQPDTLPLGVYRDVDGTMKYITGARFADHVRKVIQLAIPQIPAEELKLYSAHSIRVTACVLLHEAGYDGSFIKLRLRWKSECYTIYLRDTKIIRVQHNKALQLADEQLIEMAIGALASA